MKQTILFFLFLTLPYFVFSQENDNHSFEYASFSVMYNDNGEAKFKPSEELIRDLSLSAKRANREINKEYYYAKDINENIGLLGKDGFEMVTSTTVKTNDGSRVTFYFKRKMKKE